MAMNHDRLCPAFQHVQRYAYVEPGFVRECVCDLIARIRADERALMSGAKPSGMSDLTVTDSPQH